MAKPTSFSNALKEAQMAAGRGKAKSGGEEKKMNAAVSRLIKAFTDQNMTREGRASVLGYARGRLDSQREFQAGRQKETQAQRRERAFCNKQEDAVRREMGDGIPPAEAGREVGNEMAAVTA